VDCSLFIVPTTTTTTKKTSITIFYHNSYLAWIIIVVTDRNGIKQNFLETITDAKRISINHDKQFYPVI
jgi:hypothetical protein